MLKDLTLLVYENFVIVVFVSVPLALFFSYGISILCRNKIEDYFITLSLMGSCFFFTLSLVLFGFGHKRHQEIVVEDLKKTKNVLLSRETTVKEECQVIDSQERKVKGKILVKCNDKEGWVYPDQLEKTYGETKLKK